MVRGYQTLFMLKSTEHELPTAHKTKVPTNEEFSCYKFEFYYVHIF